MFTFLVVLTGSHGSYCQPVSPEKMELHSAGLGKDHVQNPKYSFYRLSVAFAPSITIKNKPY
jgi:hypothetical protein